MLQNLLYRLLDKSWLKLVIIGLILAGITRAASAKGPRMQTQANVFVEITLRASRTYHDPFNEVTLDVTFTDPNGRTMRVPAFWDGANVWKVRYASPLLGVHHYRSEFPDARDTGLHGVSGTVEIKPYTGQNPLLTHGPLRVARGHRYLEYADGTPFFWLGDTWWMGLCHRLHWPDEFKTLAADRVAKGFNVVQIVAGLYPDMPPFDPRGANEAGFPWEPDFARIRPAYFDAADQRLEYLAQSGLTPCIVGAWGYFIPLMGVDKAKQHWRYLVARYGALPVVWCVAGEANLPYYQAKGFPYDDRQQVKEWTEVTRYLRQLDPFHRLITIHPTGLGRLSARHATDDIALLDFDMLQTPHGTRDAVPPTVQTVRESYHDTPVLPVINGEAAYEMLNDSLPTKWTRRMFWLCMMNGAAGHTYGANGIWQVNRRGQPHGPSPTAGSPPTGYGTIAWDEAMNLPGSREVGLGKKFLAQYSWQNFEPHPEWAEFAKASVLSLAASQWIWFPEGQPAQDAPAAKRFFRRAFTLPANKVIKTAALRVSADDQFEARLNGERIGGSDPNQDESWKTGQQFDIAHFLKSGPNVLAIAAENKPAPGANPAGVIARLEVQFTDDTVFTLTSDATWRAATTAAAGWDTVAFDDAAWEGALALGAYGMAPWGQIDQAQSSDVYGPQSTGIPNGVRVIYVPDSNPIVVHHLQGHARYAASYFDPVSGATTPLPPTQADEVGSWHCPPPAGCNHDWVLVLQPKSLSE